MNPETNAKALNRYYSKIKKIKEYLGGKCNECGSLENLEIDHIDWRTKIFEISTRINLSWERLKEEFDKCQLLCNFCHSKKSVIDRREQLFGTSDQPHGTYWRYKKYECRCEECTQAYSEYNRKFKPESKRPVRKPRICGTRAMYIKGCRCADCKKANSVYMVDFYKKNGRK